MGGEAGYSESGSGSSFNQDIWGGQEGALSDLYSNASSLFGNMNPSNVSDTANRITDAGFQGQSQLLGGGAVGDTSDVRSALMGSLDQSGRGSNTGRMYESIVGGQGNTYIDPMVDAMKSGAMENLDRVQSGTGLDASAMGQGGSSRHAMQNAMQARSVNQYMMNQEANMRGGAYDKDLAMKMDIARQADQGVQNTQRNYMNMLGMSDQNVGSGLGMGNSLMNPQMQSFNAPWNALGQYSNTIGSPTVLSSGQSSANSMGANAGASVTGK